MKTKLVRFHSEDNLRLDGLLFEPETKTDRIVVQVHGNASTFHANMFIETFANEITNCGYAFLTFNNRGAGLDTKFYKELYGESVDRVVIGARNEIFEDCLLDISGAVNFVKNKGFKEIVLSGHSYGCNKVTYYAMNNPDFTGGIILLAPCDSNDRTRMSSLKLARDMENLDIFRYRNGECILAHVEVKNDILVQIGTDDNYIIQKNKQECIDFLKKAFCNAKVTGHLIEGANHNYDGKYMEVAQNIVKWLRERQDEQFIKPESNKKLSRIV